MLRLAGVRMRLGARQVLDGLDLTLARGECYGLLGPNGSGKSTAVHVACRLLEPDAGRVEVGGLRGRRESQRLLGLCPQEIALYRDLRPAENLDFHARLHGLAAPARRRRVAELMRQFGLDAHAETVAGELSGGLQQRLNIAVALVHAPPLLILDEPTGALDLDARHALWALIEDLRAAGTTLLLTTHRMEEAERLCSRVGILQGGRLAAEGSVAELLARVPAQAVATVRARDPQALRCRAAQLGWTTREQAGGLACLLPRAESLRGVVEALNGVEVSAVSVQPVGLQHAYLEIVGDAAAVAP